MKFLALLKNVLAVCFWGILIFALESTYVSILTIAAALLHECGHMIVTLFFTKSKSGKLTGDISGFRIQTEGLSYGEEFLCAAGGPMINIVTFAICLLTGGVYILTFGLLNLLTALANLLPIESYDGYRIAHSAMCLFGFDGGRAEYILSHVSFIFSVLMTFLSLYLMLKLGEGYWIFAVFFSLTLSWLIKRQKRTICEKNGDL